MKKKKVHVSKNISTKHKNIPNMIDTIKTEEVKFDRLPSECDIVDLPIKQEELNLEMNHYSTTFNQSVVRVSSLTRLEESSVDNNRVEKLNTNTAESSRQFSCHHCSLLFTCETLYIDHVNEAHRIESSTQQFHCQTCDISLMELNIYRDHLRQVHKAKSQPLVKKTKSKSNRSIEPDLNDPNFYCKSCATNHQNRGLFRQHLRRAHKMILKPKKNQYQQTIILNLNPNGPSF